jgi:diacylglycerol kinase (ATP)
MNSRDNWFQKRVRSFRYAFQGIGHLLKEQPNAIIHLVCAILVIGAGFIVHLSASEWLWIIAAIGAVFVMELVNSAFEETINLLSPEWHEKAGKIKDMAAAAVLLTAIAAIIVGTIIFVPKIINLFSS